jgi:Rrf2 family protein
LDGLVRLTARSEYGLLAMIDLASIAGSQPISAREIAERQGIPLKFLEQLLVALRRAGVVSSVRGAHGGFTLDRGAADVTVLEIVEALEGPLTTTVCDGERAANCGKTGSCAASIVWTRATDAVRDVFEDTTLDQLVVQQRSLDAG